MLPYWYSANKPHFQIFMRLHDDVHLREVWTDAQSCKCVCVWSEREERERTHSRLAQAPAERSVVCGTAAWLRLTGEAT